MGIHDGYRELSEEPARTRIEREFEQINDKLRSAAHAYYIEDRPIMTDAEYDSLIMQARELEKRVSQAIIDAERLKGSPVYDVVGGVAKDLKPAKHDTPMISLRTETDTTDAPILAFAKRVEQKLEENNYPPGLWQFCAEYKFDGLALSLKYSGGRLIRAATRGDGYEGENVTHNAMVIDSIPKSVKFNGDLEVRGEVMMTKEMFKQLNSDALLNGGRVFVNPRNAAAGSLRLLDSNECRRRGLIFMAYSAEGSVIDEIDSHIVRMAYLRDNGFNTPEAVLSDTCKGMYEFYKHALDTRAAIPFEIDGVVYKVNEHSFQEILGVTGKEPNWAIAHKFPPEEVTTILESIDVQVGRTGFLTPVARIKPVFVGGTTVTNITLNNVFDIRRKDVRVGDTVFVRRAGDVIPEITTRANRSRPHYVPNFRMPLICPVCGGAVVREKGASKYRCTNTLGCYAQLKGALLHYCSRNCMDIHGFGEKTIDALVDGQLVFSIADIYNLSQDKLEKVEITGKTAANLLSAIDGSRVASLARFIYALGIRHVGEQAAIDLAEHFRSIEAFMSANVPDLMEVKDIGAITASSIWLFITHPQKVEIIEKAIRDGKLLLTMPTKKEAIEGPLKGHTYVVSGKLTHYELVAPTKTRENFIEVLKAAGAAVSDTVSKDTTALIIGDKPSSKLAKAKALGVRVMTDAEAMVDLLGFSHVGKL